MLIVHNALSGWGAEKNLRAISTYCGSERQVSYLLTVEQPGRNYEEDVHFLGAFQLRPNSITRWINFILKAFCFIAWFRDHSWKYDVILVTSGEETLLAFYAKVLFSPQSRFIVFNQTNWTEEMRRAGWGARMIGFFYISVCRDCDAVFCLSKGCAQDLAEVHGVLTPIYVHPACVPPGRIEENSVRCGSASGRSCKTILYVGRLSNIQKRVDLLIEAIHAIKTPVPFRALIVGSGEDEEWLKKRVQDLGLSEKISFIPPTDNPYKYYESSDLFTITSDYEGFGNVIIEAMSCGLPVIATDCPSGPAEILNHGEYGILVSRGDSAAIAKGILHVLENEPVANELRCKSLKRSRDFNCNDVFERFWKSVEQTLNT